MCSRFTLQRSLDEIITELEISLFDDIAELEPAYNLAPTCDVPVVARASNGERKIRQLRWGLIPSWAKNPKIGARLINARAETVAEKPAFRDAFRSRRCLVPMSGFYEWHKQGDIKQPYYFYPADAPFFIVAGIWERWLNPDREPLDTFAILTTQANEIIAPIHDRMPLILPKSNIEDWLNPAHRTPNDLGGLLQPYPAVIMRRHPVSTRVNNPRHEGAELIAPGPLATQNGD